jgi:hypothetical protein
MKRAPHWFLIGLLGGFFGSHDGDRAPDVRAAHAQTPTNATVSAQSTSSDRKQLSITVYNQNFGLVRDVRAVKAPAGKVALEFRDVASSIQPQTVHIESHGSKLQVLEQNYRFDLLSPQTLLEKYVGRTVKLYRWNEKLGREDVVNAEVLSTHQGPVLKIGNEITFEYPGRMAFAELPRNLIAKPTLVWLLHTTGANPTLQATYLTEGLNWQSDYVLALASNESTAQLTGWVTLTNQSGASFDHARLQLVAGDVQKIHADNDAPPMALMSVEKRVSAPSAFQQESLHEYHLYTLDRPVSVLHNETKQVTLLDAHGVKVTKKFIVRGESHYFRGSHPGVDDRIKVGVYLEFSNRKAHGLGMPLPKGTIRVYKADSSGARQFVGEDHIDHTPVDETVTIKTGDAFDLVAERKQTDYNTLGKCSHESAWEVALRNQRSTPAQVEILEPVGGDWTVVSSNLTATKKDQHTLRFVANVPAKGSFTLKYRVRTRYC